jgi:hypothetical protein
LSLSIRELPPSLRGAKRRSNPGNLIAFARDLDCFAPLSMTNKADTNYQPKPQ